MRKSGRLLAILLVFAFLNAVVVAPAFAQAAAPAGGGGAAASGGGAAASGAGAEGTGEGEGDVREKVEETFGSVEQAGTEVSESIRTTVAGAVGVEGALGADGMSMDELNSKLNEGDLEDLAQQIQSGVDNVESFVAGEGESGQEFLDMIQQVGDRMGEPVDLFGEAAKLGEENPLLQNIETLSTNLETDATAMADSLRGSLTEAGDGVGGITAAGSGSVDGYSGGAAEAISGQLDPLSGMRSDPAGFERTYGEVFSAGSTDGTTTTSATMTLAGGRLSTGDDLRGMATNDISHNSLMLQGEAWAGPRIEAGVESTYLGGAGQVSVNNTLTAGGVVSGEGNASWLTDTALVDASGNVSATVGVLNTTTVRNDIDLGGGFGTNQTAVLEVGAGAQARANGTLYAGQNGLEVSGGATARVGAWADASGSTSAQYRGQNLFTAEGSAGAGLGLGAGAEGGVAFRSDRVGFSAQVTVGPVTLGGGVYVNPVAMGQVAVDYGGRAVDAVGRGVSAVGSGIRSGASAIGQGARNLWSRIW